MSILRFCFNITSHRSFHQHIQEMRTMRITRIRCQRSRTSRPPDNETQEGDQGSDSEPQQVLLGVYFSHVSQGIERQTDYAKEARMGQTQFLWAISASLLLISTSNYLCPYETSPTHKRYAVFSEAITPPLSKKLCPMTHTTQILLCNF